MQVMLLSVESASDIPVSRVLTFRSGNRKIEILGEGKDDKNRELVLWLDLEVVGIWGTRQQELDGGER